MVELSLFNSLRRPPGPKNLLGRTSPDQFVFDMGYSRARRPGFRPWRAIAASALLIRPELLIGPLVFVSLSFGLFEASEGLAPLESRTVGRPHVRLGGRAAPGVNRGNGRPRTKARGAGEKRQGDSIRRPAGMRPLKKLNPVSSLCIKRTGASPSCLESISQTPALSPIPSACLLRRKRPLSVERSLRTPFIPRRPKIARFLFSSKEFVHFERRRRRLWLTSALRRPFRFGGSPSGRRSVGRRRG